MKNKISLIISIVALLSLPVSVWTWADARYQQKEDAQRTEVATVRTMQQNQLFSELRILDYLIAQAKMNYRKDPSPQRASELERLKRRREAVAQELQNLLKRR